MNSGSSLIMGFHRLAYTYFFHSNRCVLYIFSWYGADFLMKAAHITRAKTWQTASGVCEESMHIQRYI